MQYKNYIIDLASRGSKILKYFEKNDDYNVTILLSLAAPIFIIPYERLCKNHPFSDKDKFIHIDKNIKNELKNMINESSLFFDIDLKFCNNIEKEKLKKSDFSNLTFDKLDEQKKVEEVISIIRNALAHGNLYTNSNDKSIETLYFVSRINKTNCSDEILEKYPNKIEKNEIQTICKKIRQCNEDNADYKIIECSVEDFKIFFKNWIKLLNKK